MTTEETKEKDKVFSLRKQTRGNKFPPRRASPRECCSDRLLGKRTHKFSYVRSLGEIYISRKSAEGRDFIILNILVNIVGSYFDDFPNGLVHFSIDQVQSVVNRDFKSERNY